MHVHVLGIANPSFTMQINLIHQYATFTLHLYMLLPKFNLIQCKVTSCKIPLSIILYLLVSLRNSSNNLGVATLKCLKHFHKVIYCPLTYIIFNFVGEGSNQNLKIDPLLSDLTPSSEEIAREVFAHIGRIEVTRTTIDVAGAETQE